MADIGRDALRAGFYQLGADRFGTNLPEYIELMSEEHMLEVAKGLVRPEAQRYSADQLRALRTVLGSIFNNKGLWLAALDRIRRATGAGIEAKRAESEKLAEECMDDLARRGLLKR